MRYVIIGSGNISNTYVQAITEIGAEDHGAALMRHENGLIGTVVASTTRSVHGTLL